MKYMKEFAIILAVTCVGELMNDIIPLPIPASIYGLVLMLILLMTKVIRIDAVEKTGDFLVEIMPMMFIPAGVGLLSAWSLLKPVFIPVLVITLVTTVIVMFVTGKVADRFVKDDIVQKGDESSC